MFMGENADILAVAALIELLLPVRHVMFMPATGLHALLLSDRWSFQYSYEESRVEQMKPVILVVIILSSTHLDKTALHLG